MKIDLAMDRVLGRFYYHILHVAEKKKSYIYYYRVS